MPCKQVAEFSRGLEHTALPVPPAGTTQRLCPRSDAAATWAAVHPQERMSPAAGGCSWEPGVQAPPPRMQGLAGRSAGVLLSP